MDSLWKKIHLSETGTTSSLRETWKAESGGHSEKTRTETRLGKLQDRLRERKGVRERGIHMDRFSSIWTDSHGY